MRVLLIRSIIHLSALLPLPISHRLALFLGWLFAVIPNDMRHITRINIHLCFPQMSAKQRHRLEKYSLIETVKTGLELGPMWLWSPQRNLALVHKIHGQHSLDQAIHRGQGVILAIPHLGMWELIGLYGSNRHTMTSLYRPPRIKALDNIMRNGRERCGATLVPTNASGIRNLYKALTRGELIAILPDQEPRWGNGVFAPFFGLPAYTATLLPRIAQKSGATILLAYAERLPKGQGFDLHFCKVSQDCYNDNQTQAAAALNQEIEACVRRHPEQYQWSYRRFSSRPDEKLPNYYR